MKESAIRKKVLGYLNSLSGCKAIKIHGNMYTEAGTPDIAGCIRGRAFFIELKKPGEEPTVIQRKRLREWADAGAITGVVESLEDVQRILSLYI